MLVCLDFLFSFLYSSDIMKRKKADAARHRKATHLINEVSMKDMELVKITEENTDDFSKMISEDLKCNLGRRFFNGLGVLDHESNPVGAMVYELLNYDSEEDTKILIHSFVSEDDEATELLMSEYGKAVSEDGAVESLYETGDEKINAVFTSHGFNAKQSESLNIVVSAGELKEVAAMAAGKKIPGYIHDMSDTPPLRYRNFLKKCLVKGKSGLLEDLGYLPLSWFEREVSICSISDEMIDGVLLVRKLPSQVLVPCLLTAFGIDFQKNLLYIMLQSAQRVVELYPEETKVVIRRHNAGVKKLTDKFFPNKNGEKVYTGRREER